MAGYAPFIPTGEENNYAGIQAAPPAPIAQKTQPGTGFWQRIQQVGVGKINVLSAVDAVKRAGGDVGQFVKQAAVSTAKAGLDTAAAVSNTDLRHTGSGSLDTAIRNKFGANPVQGMLTQAGKAPAVPYKNGANPNPSNAQKVASFMGTPNTKQTVGNAAQTAINILTLGGGEAAEKGGQFLIEQFGAQGVKELADKAGIDVTKVAVEDIPGLLAKSPVGKQAIKAIADGGKSVVSKALKTAGKSGALFGAYGVAGAASANASNKQIVKSGVESGVAGALIDGSASLLKSGFNKVTGITEAANQIRAKASAHVAAEKNADERGLPAGETKPSNQLKAGSTTKQLPEGTKAPAKNVSTTTIITKGEPATPKTIPFKEGEYTQKFNKLSANYDKAQKSLVNLTPAEQKVRGAIIDKQHQAALEQLNHEAENGKVNPDYTPGTPDTVKTVPSGFITEADADKAAATSTRSAQLDKLITEAQQKGTVNGKPASASQLRSLVRERSDLQDTAEGKTTTKTTGNPGKISSSQIKEKSSSGTTMKASDLTSYEGAPDKAQVEKYKADIKAGKPIKPLLVTRDSSGNMGIEDGKHRFEAMKQMGMTDIPVKEIDTAGKPKAPGLGESGSINPVGASQDIKDYVDKSKAVSKSTGNITKDVNARKGKIAFIQHDVAQLFPKFSKSASDRKAVDDYLEAKSAGLKTSELTDTQKQILQNVTEMQKIKQAADIESRRISGTLPSESKILQPGTYIHREVLDKGSKLERFHRGDTSTPISVKSLRKTTDSEKARVYGNLTDKDGNRIPFASKSATDDKGRVIAGGKRLTNLQTGKDLGSMKLHTNADDMEKELAPIRSQIDTITREQKILKGTKGRQLASPQRLENLEANLKNAEDKYSSVVRKYDSNELDGKVFTDKEGNKYTISQATKDEITKATGQKYVIDPEGVTAIDMARSQQRLENLRLLEKWKESPDFEKFSVKDGTANPPRGYKSIDIPQLKGYSYEPHLADTLNMLFRNRDEDGEWLNKANRVMRNTVVAIPIKHNINELIVHQIDRGASSLVNPKAYVSEAKTLIRAFDGVHNLTPEYREFVEHGGSSTSVDSESFAKAAMNHLNDVLGNEKATASISKVISSPLNAYKAFQRGTVWVSQDVLNFSRYLARRDSGMGVDDAIDQTERYNLNYQVPARVLGSRQASKLLQNTNAILFGRYRYDLFRITANTLKDAVNVTNPKQAIQAADKLAMEALVVTAFYKTVDPLIQKLSGNKNAYMTAGGTAGLAQDVYELARHQETTSQFANQQVYPSFVLSWAMEVKNNQDSFTGKTIFDPNAPEPQQVAQVTKWLGSQSAPSEQLSNIKKGSTVTGMGLALAGARFPKNSNATDKLYSLEYDSEPVYQAEAKTQAQAGNTQAAQQTMSQYNSLVLAAAKAALKQAGKPVPSDSVLLQRLKYNYVTYTPSNKTLAGWKNGTTPSLLDDLSR